MNPLESRDIARKLALGFYGNGRAQPEIVEAIIGMSYADRQQVRADARVVFERVKDPTNGMIGRKEIGEDVLSREELNPIVVRRVFLGLPRMAAHRINRPDGKPGNSFRNAKELFSSYINLYRRRESNPHLALRTGLLYPLSYVGMFVRSIELQDIRCILA